MILDINAIKRSGKTEQSFFFEYATGVCPDIPESEILAPVKLQGEAFLTESGAIVEGEVLFTVSGNCTRCLERTEKTFSVSFSEACGTDGDYPVTNGKIDLEKIIDDVILLNLPVSFLCNDDCKGICPKCGVNLNVGKCKCNN